jgi:hypothetical protein
MYTGDQKTTIGIICMGLVIVGLIYLVYMRTPFENFTNVSEDNNKRCGWSLGTCPNEQRCINGYCKTDIAQILPAVSNLPIRPARYTLAAPPVNNKIVPI